MEDVYLDELFFYFDQIRKRQATEYLLQLEIATNPHLEKEEDRRALVTKLLNLLEGKEKVEEEAQLDKNGMERLKFIMSQNPRIMVK